MEAEDTRPYRERVETYAITPDGKILGGIYDDDKNHAVFGGGIDDGETPEAAAVRELKEESGYRAYNARRIPLPPVTEDWKPPYHSAKQRERAKQFRGSRTHFVVAELDPVTKRAPQDKNNGITNVRLRALSTALKNTRIHRSEAKNITAQRRKVLRWLMDDQQQQVESPVAQLAKAAVERYRAHGVVLGALGGENAAGQHGLETTEDLPDSAWKGIAATQQPITMEQAKALRAAHTQDPDQQGVPYYFLLDRQPDGQKHIWYSDEDDPTPMDTAEQQVAARKAGETKGLKAEHLQSVLPLSIPELAKQAALQDDVQLQEHQDRVRRRLQSGDNRLLLYHGLGTGKSLSSLAAAEATGGPYAAVVPASLKPNYEKEIAKFTEGSEPEVLSYTGLGMGKQLKQDPQTLIFDEAHRLRNRETQSAQAAAQAAEKAKNVLLLTGTPITNSPGDLAGLLSLLHNKPIDAEGFEKKFVGHRKVYPSWVSRLLRRNAGDETFIQHEDDLRKLLHGKVDYQPSKLPEGVQVQEQTVHAPLSKPQLKLQNAIRSRIPPEWAWKLDKEFPLSRAELAKLNAFLTGLRQTSLSTLPFRADKDPLHAFDESGKLQRAMSDLKQEFGDDPRKKAIIFSNFIEAGLDPYAAALHREHIPYGMFHGSVPQGQRRKVLQDYNEGKLRALLLGPAGGEGISTTGTNLIQLLDPHWHESRGRQAQGRGLRFDSHQGLPEDLKNVAVRRYISESQDPALGWRLLGAKRHRTGDEILETLAARKERLNEQFRRVLQEEGSMHKMSSVSQLATEVATLNCSSNLEKQAELQSTLQKLVFNCIDLGLLFKHCHWNARGTMFKPLHDFLDTIHATLTEASDDIAERMEALDYPASGLVEDLAAQTEMASLPVKFLSPPKIVDELTTRLTKLCGMFNKAIKATEDDPVTSNMLQDMTHKLEKHLWMLRSQKEQADQAEKSAAQAALHRLTRR